MTSANLNDPSSDECLCAAGFGNTGCAACPTGLTSLNLNDPSSDECTLCADAAGCNNHGTCLSSGSCDCDAEHSGTYCENAYDDCDLSLCGSGGSCTDATRTVAGTFAYTCYCHKSGYILDETTANMPTCTKELACNNFPCENPDGVCTNYSAFENLCLRADIWVFLRYLDKSKTTFPYIHKLTAIYSKSTFK